MDTHTFNDYDPSQERHPLRRRPTLTAIGFLAASACVVAGSLSVYADIENNNVEAMVLKRDLPPDTRENHATTSIARTLTGRHDIFINCTDIASDSSVSPADTSLHTLGYVKRYRIEDGKTFTPPYITLDTSLCNDLIDTSYRTPSPDKLHDASYQMWGYHFATAAMILLHENEHLNGTDDEAKATCYAIQKLSHAIAPYYPSEGEALYYATSTADGESIQLAPEYYSPKCAPDGAYDLHLGSLYPSAPQQPTN